MSLAEPLIYLASRSPRRSELLHQIRVPYLPLSFSYEEQKRLRESPMQYVQRCAIEKARTAIRSTHYTHELPVLSADTMVLVDKKVMGKPQDRAHGCAMLRALSGRSHQVVTAVALINKQSEHMLTSTSTVTIKPLEDAEITWYWDTGEPSDKAGGYAIQGQGAQFVTHISGSYSGIMGLPIYETVALLDRFGIRP